MYYKAAVYYPKDRDIYAKVVADSSYKGSRIITFELQYPRIIHQELLTHRVFSRNSTSSRAIPVKKMLHKVWKKPFIPTYWGKNRSGMQATEETNNPVTYPYTGETFAPDILWLQAAREATYYAEGFNNAGYHKQLVNRLIEPYSYIKTIVTATEWYNFFNLRLHKDAQPEMQELAQVMKQAMDISEPEELDVDKWHLPYLTWKEKEFGYDAPMVSAARCARVSYMRHDRSAPDYKTDMRLADKLLQAGHFSVFEHQATPMSVGISVEDLGVTHVDRFGILWSGNFKNWIQYRQVLEHET